jgi:hypothetical protein
MLRKKKVFSFLIFLFSFHFLVAQGKIEGGLHVEYFQLGDRGFEDIGAMVHIPFAGRFTANYHLGLGTSNTSGFFMHAPGGVVAGLWILDNLGRGDGGLGYLTLLLCAVPEGVGYYLPTTKGKLVTHISINPLSVEYFYRSATGEEWGKMSCNFVARFKMPTGLKIPSYIAPQIAGTIIYTPGQTTARYGLRAGVTIGFEKKSE